MNALWPCHSIHAEVGVEAVGDGDPGDFFPSHSRLQARDVGLRRARGKHERRVARVQVREMGDLVGHHRTADAGMLRPAVHAGLEEGAVDDQLTAAVEQVEQARLARQVRRTRTSSPPPSTACAGARRPVRHGRGSWPFPSRASARARLPTPAVETTCVFMANLLFVAMLVACGAFVACDASACSVRPEAAGRIPSAAGSSRPRTAPAPCRWRGRPEYRDACASRR